MTELIIKGNNGINPGILRTIKEVYEEKKNIKICSLFKTDSDNVVGVYMHPLDKVLSIMNDTESTIKTDVHKDFYVYLFSLEELLYLIYKKGSAQMMNILLHNSDIKIDNHPLFNEIQAFVQKNPPLLLCSFEITNFIESNDLDREQIKLVIKLLEEFEQIYPISIKYSKEVNTIEDEIKIKNQLNLICQYLYEQDFKKIYNKDIEKLNKIFIEYQKNI